MKPRLCPGMSNSAATLISQGRSGHRDTQRGARRGRAGERRRGEAEGSVRRRRAVACGAQNRNTKLTILSTRVLEEHHGTRRNHAISPGFFEDYQDLGLQTKNWQFRVAAHRARRGCRVCHPPR